MTALCCDAVLCFECVFLPLELYSALEIGFSDQIWAARETCSVGCLLHLLSLIDSLQKAYEDVMMLISCRSWEEVPFEVVIAVQYKCMDSGAGVERI